MTDFFCKYHNGPGEKVKNRDICVDCHRKKQKEWHTKNTKKQPRERKPPNIDPAISDLLTRKW